MKLLAGLLIAVSLVLGIVGAVTAYLPSLDLADEQLVGLTLNAPAGAVAGPDGKLAPIAAKDAVITSEILAALRGSGVGRVRVKEFALDRWSGKELFALGFAGLAGGAAMVRRKTKKDLAVQSVEAAASGTSPEATLASLRDLVAKLRKDLNAIPSADQRAQMVMKVIGEAQATLLPAFIDARPLLVGRIGLGGYAQVMDRFAAAERQLNRAWSAAADSVDEEALHCLATGQSLLDEAAAKLDSLGSAA